MEPLSETEIEHFVECALREDVGSGDATTLATVPAETTASANIVAREPMVVAGIQFAKKTFLQIDDKLVTEVTHKDGEFVKAGSPLLKVRGAAQSILTAERVALNFMQRLSGIATLTWRFVDAVRGTQAVILDTRKTIPGCRRIEKYAVACGGGKNHRIGLFDMILIKDNHLAALRDQLPNPIAAAVSRARQRYPSLRVEVEAEDLEQVHQAVEASADIVLLDNMDLSTLRQAVAIVKNRAKTEASGGVSLTTVREIAETGVNFISVGALTHSAPAADIALDFI